MGLRFRGGAKTLNASAGPGDALGIRGPSLDDDPSPSPPEISHQMQPDRPAPRPKRRTKRPPDEIPKDDFPSLPPGNDADWIPSELIPSPSPGANRAPVALARKDHQALGHLAPTERWLQTSRREAVEYRSANADHLTSPSLRPLSDLIEQILAERSRISEAIQARSALLEHVHAQAKRARRISSALLVPKRRRKAVLAAAREFERQLTELQSRLDALVVDADLPLSPQSREAFATLSRTFDQLKSSAKIWGVSTSPTTERARMRVVHPYEVIRTEVVELGTGRLPGIVSDFDALYFQTASGAHLFLYPHFIAIPRTSGGYSLMDLHELIAAADEHSELSYDALGVHHRERPGKGRSPDKLAKNRQTSNRYYGELQLRSASGLLEVYQFSKADVASSFATALSAFIATLPSLGPERVAAKRTWSKTQIPDLPHVPPLMSGGVLLRSALLALVVAAAGLALISPEGRDRVQALWAGATGQVEQAASEPQASYMETPSVPVAPVAPSTQPNPVAPVAQPVPSSVAAAPTAQPKIAAPAVQPMPPVVAAAQSASPAVKTEPKKTSIPPSPPPAPQSKPAKKTNRNGTTSPPDNQPDQRPRLSTNRIIELQTKLGELGYEPGEPDGHLGQQTIDAFNQWRRETGRPAVEVIGPDDVAGFMTAISR